MKLIQYPEIHCALRDAFFAKFEDSEYGYDPEGVLGLEINERERIKCEMVKPAIDEFGHLANAIEEGDDETIEEFESYAENVMCVLERQFIEWMKTQLR